MGRTTALSASVTVALCGVLTLGPAAVASPETRTAPSAPPVGVTHLADGDAKDREQVAATIRTVTKFGAASQKTGKVAGQVMNGEKDEKKLTKARKASDKSLDNLLAIIPGGSPATANGRAASAPGSVGPDLKASVALIKADTKAMVDAALKGDVGSFTTVGASLIAHLGQLAVGIFLQSGLDTVKNTLPQLPTLTPAQPPKLPGLPGPGTTTAR
jgi:hypothetical protein